MYSVVVEATFSATHQVRCPDGTLEAKHTHEWIVRALFARRELDQMDMVIDFHEAQSGLRHVVEELDHTDLNSTNALINSNPTAERVAAYIFDRLRAAGLSTIRRVELTEAPGCVAIYERSDPAANTE